MIRLQRASAHYYLDRPQDALEDLNELVAGLDDMLRRTLGERVDQENGPG